MFDLAVIGHPIGHSLSPAIHNYWLQKHGLQGSYKAIDVLPENLSDFLKENTLTGFNATIPHKEALLPLCTNLSPEATKIGAVNTLVRSPNGWEGHNTDAQGLVENLCQKTNRKTFKNILILGAGGAARAVVVGLQNFEGTEISIANRTAEKAQVLAEEFQCKTQPWAGWGLSQVDLLINTTSLGMAGQPPLEIDLTPLPDQAIVYDIVYNPLQTDLLHQARQHGCQTVDGLGMLLHQARYAFEIWTGVLPKIDGEVTRLCHQALRQ